MRWRRDAGGERAKKEKTLEAGVEGECKGGKCAKMEMRCDAGVKGECE